MSLSFLPSRFVPILGDARDAPHLIKQASVNYYVVPPTFRNPKALLLANNKALKPNQDYGQRPPRRPRKDEKEKDGAMGQKTSRTSNPRLCSSSPHMPSSRLTISYSLPFMFFFPLIIPCLSSLQWTNPGRGGCPRFAIPICLVLSSGLVVFPIFHPIPNSSPVIPTSPHRPSWRFLSLLPSTNRPAPTTFATRK